MRRPHERLPVPKLCNVCTADEVSLQLNATLNRYEYVCANCDARVGCHSGSNEPLGVLAHSEIRKLRAIAHSYFDRIWKRGLMPRHKAYAWLSNKLQLSREDCHFSRLEEWQLEKAIHICQKFLSPKSLIDFRRKQKQDAKRAKHIEREKRIIRRRKSG